MHVHFIAPERFVRASHEIVRHPRLKGTAKTLLLWGLSLPPGSRETVQSIGSRMPEGRMAVSSARSQLIDEGYLHVRHVQHPTKGTWSTRTLLSSVPLTAPEQIADAWAAATPADQGPTQVHNPAVGPPDPQALGTSPKGEKTEGKTTHPAPAPAPARARVPAPRTGGDEPPPPPDTATAAAAARLLRRITATEPRLPLGLTEALTLAPLVAQWRTRDPREEHLRQALTTGLPDHVAVPTAFLRNRLQRKMPPAPQPPPPPRPRHECHHCAVPLPQPGTCRPCAGLPPLIPQPDPHATAERNRRGLARTRHALRANRTLLPA
jgi:hypothetical protein